MRIACRDCGKEIDIAPIKGLYQIVLCEACAHRLKIERTKKYKPSAVWVDRKEAESTIE